MFAEQDGFLYLPGLQRAVNDCLDDRGFWLLPMGESRLQDSVPDAAEQGDGYCRSQRTSFVKVRARTGRM